MLRAHANAIYHLLGMQFGAEYPPFVSQSHCEFFSDFKANSSRLRQEILKPFPSFFHQMTNWLLMVSSKRFGTTSLPRTLAVCSMTQGFLRSQMKLQLLIFMILMTLTPIVILVMDNVSQLICRYVCIDL